MGSYVLVATLEVNGKTLKAKSTFKINPVEAPPTVTARDYTGVYDGQPHSITVTAPAGTNVTYSTDGINYSAANPAYTNAGTYTIHYDVDGTKGTAAVRITPRTVSIRWSEETAFRYTGEPQAPTAEAEGLLPGDTCEVEVSGAQTEPGDYTAEAVRLSNPNYRLPTSGTTQEFRIIRASTSAPSTPSYPIIVRDEAPEGGLVRASRDWSHRGATITVTAEPLEGFRLEQVTAVTRDGKSLRLTEKEGSGCKYTFTMPADKVFVEAVFSREETASTAGTGGEDAPAEPEIHAVSESPAVPEGTALTCPGVTACPIWPYFDANPSAWYHDGVHYCLETGLMTGYDDATFRPRDTVSRAEALVMLWRLRGSPAADSAPAFMDVSEAAWYAGAVRWAASESIVLGTGTGRFAPGEMLTHRQLNTILQRCAQSMGLEPPALMGEDPAALVSRAQAAVALADFAQNTLK
ncbi:MAG: S-layer homology domain-containing protein [Oscillospiraceae bacterium]|nr:S-layer homology domain-containing protein [Oscillospiraceae bacterium]